MKPWMAGLAWVVAAGLAGPGCKAGPETGADSTGHSQGTPERESGAALVLVASQEQGVVRVGLDYQVAPGVVRPRALEVFLESSPQLRFLEAQAGDAATAAGKQLVVQPRDGAVLRTVLFSTASLETMGPGRLVTWTFERVGTGTARLELVDPGSPVLAPAGANEGLELGNPLLVSLD